MSLKQLRRHAETCYEQFGIWGISVRSGPEAGVPELAAEIPHPQIRLSTAANVRAAGFEIWPSGRHANHCTIVISSYEPTDSELSNLEHAFDEAIDRPRPDANQS